MQYVHLQKPRWSTYPKAVEAVDQPVYRHANNAQLIGGGYLRKVRGIFQVTATRQLEKMPELDFIETHINHVKLLNKIIIWLAHVPTIW